MKVIIPHYTTVEEAIVIVDRSANDLFEGAGGKSVELLDRRKDWNGPLMDFSLTARVGYVSLPICGMVVVDDVNVTVDCELPALVKLFVGEDTIRADVSRKVRRMFAA